MLEYATTSHDLTHRRAILRNNARRRGVFSWGKLSDAMPKVFDSGVAIMREFPVTRRYLVGVSGGRDSVALLHWLDSLGYRKLIVCHLDHGMRGRAGRADAAFVNRLARRLKLVIEIDSANVPSIAKKTKASLETTARHARYAFFARIARRKRCRTIFLAHQADDQVETFLINLFRGSGGKGLGAMRAVSVQSIASTELQIVRPLLGVWREEIDAYLETYRLRFRDDASNRDLAPLRNRVRHKIIPLLEEYFGRRIRWSIWRAAHLIAEDESVLEALISSNFTTEAKLSLQELRLLPIALQRRAIKKWLEQKNVANVGYEIVESVRTLLDSATGPAKINLARGLHVRRRAGKIFIE